MKILKNKRYKELLDYEIKYKELKSKLELYENGVYYSSKLDEKEEEIEKLTKQLEVGKQQYNDLVEEKEKLQEQLYYLNDDI